MKPIKEIRTRLDEIDQRLVDVLAQRLDLVREVASIKQQDREGGSIRYPERERQLLSRAMELGQQRGLDGHYVARLFGEILDHSVRVQHALLTHPEREAEQAPIRVVYQGREGSYSQLASTRHFSSWQGQAELRGLDSFRAALIAIEGGQADYAVLPIENSVAGSINEVYELLRRKNLAIVGEEILEVNHCLLALEPLPMSRIRRVYSQLPALMQCSEFLDGLNNVQVESFTDTAMSCLKLREEQDLSQAAIASIEAARVYGLTVLKEGIANQPHNQTRFVVVSTKAIEQDPRIRCKTSLLMAARHEPGALLEALGVFAEHDLNLTKLESRPRPENPWEYMFYADIEGNLADDAVQNALEALRKKCRFLKVFGSYPFHSSQGNQRLEKTQNAPQKAVAPDVSATEDDLIARLEKKPYRLASRRGRREDTIVHVANVEVGGAAPIMIAGPCSVENWQQVRSTAEEVKARGASILRGGCFKPRTSPYAFQGLGYEGLEMLAAAGREVGLPIITEVLDPGDVEAVSAQADVLQIGARNMQNFALLKEVGKVDCPVMLKRGMMASIDEWLAAAEYVLSHGNQQVILCERGIRTFETATRNTLDLSAVPVVRERSHLPIIVDPSHACGTWRWVTPMAKAAIAAGAHGLMVEVHPKPDEALSDGPQALDFWRFSELMQELEGQIH